MKSGLVHALFPHRSVSERHSVPLSFSPTCNVLGHGTDPHRWVSLGLAVRSGFLMYELLHCFRRCAFDDFDRNEIKYHSHPHRHCFRWHARVAGTWNHWLADIFATTASRCLFEKAGAPLFMVLSLLLDWSLLTTAMDPMILVLSPMYRIG